MTDAAQIIWREHATIARVLDCLRDHLRTCAESAAQPDPALLNAIVYYMEGFADALHHPKEEHYLLPALIRREPKLALLGETIQQEHVQGARMLTDLRHRIDACVTEPQTFEELRDAAEAYIEFELQHMAREDRGLLPVAMEVLSEEDWTALNKAFTRDEDPLFGTERQERFKVLFDAIMSMEPKLTG